MAARGLRSSWASIARNSSLLRSAAAQLLLAFSQGQLAAPPLGYVTKDEDDAGEPSLIIVNRGRAVVDRQFTPRFLDQHHVISQADNFAVLQARRAGLSATWRVVSSTMRNTSLRGLPQLPSCSSRSNSRLRN